MVFHLLILCLLLGAFYLVFIKDWNIIRLSDGIEKGDFPKVSHSSVLCLKKLIKIVAIFSYLLISVLGNLLYVYLHDFVNQTELVFLEIALLSFNMLLRLNLNPFIDWLLPSKHRFERTERTIILLLCFTDTMTPFIATLFYDDRCFHQLIVTPNKSTTSFQTETYILYYPDYSCAEYAVNERTLQFIPPFIYSGECRDAVLTNFFPLLSCRVLVKLSCIPYFIVILPTAKRIYRYNCCCFDGFDVDVLKNMY